MTNCPTCHFGEIIESNTSIFPYYCNTCGSVYKFRPYNLNLAAEKIEAEFEESQKKNPRPLDVILSSIPISICDILRIDHEMRKLKALLPDKIKKYLTFSETGALIVQLPFSS